MKKTLILALALLSLTHIRADEGMWLPMLLDQKYNEMVRKGLKMTPDMIYSVNHSSLKDAIVQFGSGCTAEMISAEGLMITNHHCGYSSIAEVSTVEDNYLKEGFWSKNKTEEIPIPGLTAKFLIEMRDVTKEVMKALPRTTRKSGDKDFDEAFDKISQQLVEAATKNSNYTAEVKPLYNGNQYFLWVYQIYTDVRLVGTPPESLGKFGGDTDNWMWPRHTADFSIFRVYADKNNEPAKYAENNVPYKPKHFLPVSIAGIKQGDYTMIMGYPARTDRYATSEDVKTSIEYINPSIVDLRDTRLKIMKAEMQKDPAVRLQLASKYARTSNYWKYFIGQTEQLKRFDVINKKKKEESDFEKWAGSRKDYRGLFDDIKQEQKDYRSVIKPYYYYNEGLFTPSLVLVGYKMYKNKLQYLSEEPDTAKFVETMTADYRSLMTSYNAIIDPKIFSAINLKFYQDIDQEFSPPALTDMVADMTGDQKEDFDSAATYLYQHSILADTAQVIQLIEKRDFESLFEDPLYRYATGLKEVYETKVKQPVLESREKQSEYARIYLQGLLAKNEGEAMYPDANSTMRLSYGSVEPYYPRDAVYYDYFTTLEGLVEKYKPGDYEFDAPIEVIELYKDEDYGRYADRDGRLHLCFLSTNDITGGNSGSPIMNGKGHLLGLAFDGNWEAMSGDIYFDSKYKRTINVDIRYVLWIIEKLGKAPNIISEMNVIENYNE